MSGSALVRAAARNNAEWCDAFCRTYGIVGRFDTDSWWSPVRGFRPLFRAEWLLREPGRARAGSDRGWSALTTQAQLVEWESTWAESHEASGFFRPALLVDEAVRMLARYDGGRILAGAVANRSTTVIGLSNVFDAGGDQESAWLGAAAAANAL